MCYQTGPQETPAHPERCDESDLAMSPSIAHTRHAGLSTVAQRRAKTHLQHCVSRVEDQKQQNAGLPQYLAPEVRDIKFFTAFKKAVIAHIRSQ